MAKPEVYMKLFVIATPLILVFVSGTLSAQQTAPTQTGAQTGATTSSETVVENLSEQGGFIGSGRPEGFVGTVEIYNRTTNARSSSTARTTTTTRPRTSITTSSAAAQRRTTVPGVSTTGAAGQTIRSATSIERDSALFSMQRTLPTRASATLESQLLRLPGIQHGQVSLSDSPTGTIAVLTGAAASDRERRVAQQLLLLEPGISQVQNLLEIP